VAIPQTEGPYGILRHFAKSVLRDLLMLIAGVYHLLFPQVHQLVCDLPDN